jgi:beta-glucosidase-like glycosyl hydrolase
MIELFPYKETLRRAPPYAVMISHLWIKAVDSDTIPATLSPNAINGLLRQRLGFDGVIYTDAIADALYAKQRFSGKLPVTVGERMEFGKGMRSR